MSPTQQPAEQAAGVLPDSAKEQTREQFEKLLEHNKKLSQKVAQLEQQQPQFNSVLDEMPQQQPAYGSLSPAQVQDLTSGLIDANGYIDPVLLNATLNEANVKAQRANDRAMLAEQRMAKFEETQLVRDVHSKHPTLDPYNPSFDQEFYDGVKTVIRGQMKKGYEDFQAAADQVAEQLKNRNTQSQQSQQVKEEEQKKVLAQRENASTKSAGKTTDTSSYEDLEDGVRKGDTLSIGQLLQKSGY